jgi:hypothetical protein
VDEYGDIKDRVEVDDRREPAVRKKARVGDGIEGSDKFLPKLEFPRAYFERGWGYGIEEAQRALFVDIARKDGDERGRLFFVLLV